MNNVRRVLLSFDKSQNDIPVLCICRETTTMFSTNTDVEVERFITGDDAVLVWELITGKKVSDDNDKCN